MAKTSLYNVVLTGDSALVTIGNEKWEFVRGSNPWDAEAWAHGLKQKIGDAGAISRDPETGRTASPAEKQARMAGIANRLASTGEWNMVGHGGGAEGGLLFRALVELGGNPETIRARLADMSKSEQAALRANPRVAPVIDSLRAKGAEDVDTDAMLDDIL